MSMNKSNLMKTADLPNETLDKHLHNDRFFSAVDVIESEIYKLPSNTCKILFDKENN